MKKIILIDPQGKDILYFLNNWKILLIIVDSPASKKRLLDTCSNNYDLKVLTINDLLTLPVQDKFSDEVIKQFEHLEGKFIYNNSRFYNSLPKLRYIYLNCLFFWFNFISINKPNIIFSTTEFHAQCFDLIPLEIGKKMKIPSFFCSGVSEYKYPLKIITNFNNKQLLIINDKRVDKKLLKKNLFEGRMYSKNFSLFKSFLIKFKKVLRYKWHESFNIFLTILKIKIYNFFGYLIFEFLSSLFRRGLVNYHTGKSIVIIQSHHSILHTISSFIYLKFGLRKYKSVSIEQIPNKNFIYFPLSMEPEAVLTQSRLNQQLYIAEVIANSLPKDWSLVVKEHPHQFKLNLPSTYYYLINLRIMKWFKSYEFFSKNKKIILIDSNVHSSLILKKANAVFSINGSILIEGLFKNVLAGCVKEVPLSNLSKNIFQISSKRDIDDFIRKITFSKKKITKINIDYNKIFLNDIKGKKKIEKVLYNYIDRTS